MKKKDILEKIKYGIKEKKETSPLLFISDDLAQLDIYIDYVIEELFLCFNVDKNNIYSIDGNDKTIKIDEIRKIIGKSYQRPNNLFQIFIIKDISRLTLPAANSMLKFLEEPGIGNIVFLTNRSESGILETILSRVRISNIKYDLKIEKSYDEDIINNYINGVDKELLFYLYNKNLTKEDYLSIFRDILVSLIRNRKYLFLLDDIEKTINLIQKNNILPKYNLDNILFKINN